MAESGRTDLFQFFAACESEDYIAIISLFARTLPMDVSDADVASAITRNGPVLELVDRPKPTPS